MPRIVFGEAIELYYQSPNEMVAHLAGTVEAGEIHLETDARPGEAHTPVIVHIPWLGQDVRLNARIVQTRGEPGSEGLRLALSDGPRDTIDKLREYIGKFRSGAILEESHDATGGGAPVPPEQRIRAMAPTLRAMLAAKGTPEERLILARDPDPRVIEFLMKNPSLTIEEVRRLAGRLNLHQGHFSQISRNPAWMADELVRTALARNPRLPEFMAETVLMTMSTPFLKNLAESMNTTAATRRAAVHVLQGRGIVVSARRGH